MKINTKHILFKIHNYTLVRKDEKEFSIQILENAVKDSTPKFIAQPFISEKLPCNTEFVINGEDHLELLQRLLDLVSDLPLGEIFPANMTAAVHYEPSALNQ